MFFASSSQSVAATPFTKDYYNILEVPQTSTPEQIKEAYRKLVKRYHPDARASAPGDVHEPNPDKFREVTEAYQVLSVRESRVTYDLQRKKNPDSYKPLSAREEELTNRRDLRNKQGLTPQESPLSGSYAEERLQQLKKEREKYNVNHLGYYQGGLPQRDKGPIRGKGLGNPGEIHAVDVHNFLEYNHQDTHLVSSEDAIKFKHWMTSDIIDFKMSRPSYVTYFDRNYEFVKDRSYFLSLLILLGGIGYLSNKYYYERDRLRRTERLDKIEELPAHHFNNRGGVLIKKEFVGFEKYHQNSDDMMKWYKMAYPKLFSEAKE